MDETLRRWPGRSAPSFAPARVESVRLDPEFTEALKSGAMRDREPPSDVIRRRCGVSDGETDLAHSYATLGGTSRTFGLHFGHISGAAPHANARRPFNPAKNGSRRPLEMLRDQREGLLLGGFP